MTLGSGSLGSAPLGGLSFNEVAARFPELPVVLVQAVVIPGGRNTEGQLIEAVTPAWRAILEILIRNPEEMFAIPSRKWEEIIAGIYRENGFDRVTLTPRSGDAGRDVIAEKSGFGALRFVEQVKAYRRGHVVTAEEVRALGFVLQADRAATKGIVTTTSKFAPRILDDPLIRPYVPTRIELMDGAKLIERLKISKDGK